ncbi:hypothetical protein [Brevundimonas sp.]|uniref:hypothetical protein n=1 Tax=Brevundimonas sp. TaxID=1871086 RepID=UPI0028AFA387|nr:hypothetical protein [Brevundimonas sp.]
MSAMREWIAAAGVMALAAAGDYQRDDFGPRTKWRHKAKRPKTAASIKRAKGQKAQRMARRKNRK